MRDLSFSAQGILLDERDGLAGQRVFRDRWPGGGRFVLEHIVGGDAMEAEDEQDFLKKGEPGDFLILTMSQVGLFAAVVPADEPPLRAVRIPGVDGAHSSQPLMIVSRRSKPNARSLIATIGGPCSRL